MRYVTDCLTWRYLLKIASTSRSGRTMYAGFNRGDILFITNTTPKPYTIGDIVVFIWAKL
ncbi:hypothetical protein HYPSUDRAFT_195377 [Hypholoma sublateritium FD-334 SS-4]|uniref:Uncharacterized protein n=1 Tax=Hypholoma sublateritium (strain FD-334 SS-4) TaxID=945553 RepID=A0A0D2NC75_HYPSF|nr:hypothetical protein HYPSUDRAFT_195377 [Hypholoma sublateritium FD-334 SS-4]